MTFREADSQITGDPVCEAGSKDGEEGGCHAAVCFVAAFLAGFSDLVATLCTGTHQPAFWGYGVRDGLGP